MADELGFSGRVARYFLRSELTPLLALTALLMGVFAVLVTPREEEPQINVTVRQHHHRLPGRQRSPGGEPGGLADGEGPGRDRRREAHLLGVAARRGRAHRAVRGRRGAHRGHRPALQRRLLQSGLAAARLRRAAAADQAQGHRRRADPVPDPVDERSRRARRTSSARWRGPSRPRSSACRGRATSTPSAVPTASCAWCWIRRSCPASACRPTISWRPWRRPARPSRPACWSAMTG